MAELMGDGSDPSQGGTGPVIGRGLGDSPSLFSVTNPLDWIWGHTMLLLQRLTRDRLGQ